MEDKMNAKPSTSTTAVNEDTESDVMELEYNPLTADERIQMKIEFLETKLGKLENRSVNFEDEETETRLDNQEQDIKKQLIVLKQSIPASTHSTKNDDKDLLTVNGTGSKLLDKRITWKLQNMAKNSIGRLEPCIDKATLIQICEECRREENESVIPINKAEFKRFIFITTLKIAKAKSRNGLQKWDDYLNDDDLNALKAELGSSDSGADYEANSEMEELFQQAEMSGDELSDDGDVCSDNLSDEELSEDLESMRLAEQEFTVPETTATLVPVHEVIEETPNNGNTMESSVGNTEEDSSYCEIVYEHIQLIEEPVKYVYTSTFEAHAIEDDDDIIFKKETPYEEPVNAKKNDYVWNWLANTGDIPDPVLDEPESKRARYADYDMDDGDCG